MKAIVKKTLALFIVICVIGLFSVSATYASNEELDTVDGFMYDGVTEVLLGEYIENDIMPIDNYVEYDTYKVYDQGIIKTWSYLSNPYFIRSIARGMTYQKSQTVSATVSASFSGTYPTAAESAMRKAFNLSSSGTKTVTETIQLSGPGKGYSSRDFYYKKGRHTHKVKIVKERQSNWDGVLSTKTYYAEVGEPAIKCYSKDTK